MLLPLTSVAVVGLLLVPRASEAEAEAGTRASAKREDKTVNASLRFRRSSSSDKCSKIKFRISVGRVRNGYFIFCFFFPGYGCSRLEKRVSGKDEVMYDEMESGGWPFVGMRCSLHVRSDVVFVAFGVC